MFTIFRCETRAEKREFFKKKKRKVNEIERQRKKQKYLGFSVKR